MLTLPFGLLAFCSLLYFLIAGGSSAAIFLNPHAILLVVGGSLATLAISNPTQTVLSLMSILKLLRRKEYRPQDLNQALISLSERRDAKLSVSHPLMEYAQGMWEQGLDAETSLELIKQKAEQLNQETGLAVLTLKNLSKYPPALGMMGTVIGMVTLFSNLTPESKGQIGPNLALAMTATFYGLLLANSVLMPLADRIQVIHQERVRQNKFIFRILRLIHTGQSGMVIREEVYGKAS